LLKQKISQISEILKAILVKIAFSLEGLIVFIKPRWKKVFLYSSISFTLIMALMFGGVYIQYNLDKVSIESSLRNYRLWMEGTGGFQEKPTIKIYGSGKHLLGEYIPERISRISLNNCSRMNWLKKATVSSEDRNFYKHKGVSFRGIFRAALRNVLSLNIREGAGTITQQLGRNLFTVRSTPAILRKIYETYTAFLIEELYNKDEILCLYLNKIYMGEGRIGAEEASWFYFRKPPWTLTAAEASMIVGIFPSPARYSPLNDIVTALKKQDLVIETLIRDSHLKSSEKKKIVNEFKTSYGVKSGEKEFSSGTIGLYGASRYFRLNSAPDVNEYAIDFLRKNFPEDVINEGGIQIFTSIDPKKQANATSAIRRGVEKIRAKFNKKSSPNTKELKQLESGLNGVLVSIDPNEGFIKAAVGGYTVNDSGGQINRITTMKRQPGSALKGFLYAAAIEEKILDESSTVVDEPIQISGYSPRNWYKGYKGKIFLKQAIAQSVNTVAVKILNDLGIGKFKSYLGLALGLDFMDYTGRFPNNLTIALGSAELTPLELALLYSSIANGGSSITPKLILKIEKKSGEILWEDISSSRKEQVFSKSTCKSIIHLMESVFEEDGTADWVSKRRNKTGDFLTFPVAGKSGTVQTDEIIRKKFSGAEGVHDVWFVGLVPKNVTVVWIGHDMGVPFNASGASNAGSVWANFAQSSFAGMSDKEFFHDESEANQNNPGTLEKLPDEKNENTHQNPPEIITTPEEKPKG